MNPVIIIPAYNHGEQIGPVIDDALQTGLPVIVIDDGSTDSTLSVAQQFTEITVLHHQRNAGKGAALLTGFTHAIEAGYDWAVTLDADGQHVPGDVVSLLHCVQDGQRCMVIGRRQGMDGDVHVPWTSRFGRGFSNFWVWVSGGAKVSDSQSGFRLYPLPEVAQLEVKARRYQYEVEVLVKAQIRGIPIREADVQVVYQPKGKRVSHFRPWVDFMRNSVTFSRLITERIFGQHRS